MNNFFFVVMCATELARFIPRDTGHGMHGGHPFDPRILYDM